MLDAGVSLDLRRAKKDKFDFEVASVDRQGFPVNDVKSILSETIPPPRGNQQRYSDLETGSRSGRHQSPSPRDADDFTWSFPGDVLALMIPLRLFAGAGCGVFTATLFDADGNSRVFNVTPDVLGPILHGGFRPNPTMLLVPDDLGPIEKLELRGSGCHYFGGLEYFH